MAATKIKVTFGKIKVHHDEDWFGPGEWAFKASVRRLPSNAETIVGDPNAVMEVNDGDTKRLNWSGEVEIKPEDEAVEISLRGTDKDLLFDDDLGQIKITLSAPIVHDYELHLPSSEGAFTAWVSVKIMADSGGSPGHITTILGHEDSTASCTINEEMTDKLVHICPVTPVPWSHGLPPIPKGVQMLSASSQEDKAISISDTKPNSLVNPALIPAISTTLTDFQDRVARIRITQFRPKDLDLSKLIWKAATANIKFWHNSRSVNEVKGGREIKAYGVLAGGDDEEGKIEVYWDGPGEEKLAVYRAWVGKRKQIVTRGNIIKCSEATIGGVAIQNPTFTDADVKKHIDYTNLLLWQMGIELVLDTDATTYQNAELKQQGIFEVSNPENHTFNVVKNRSIVAPMLNSRKGVFNLVYLHSCAHKPNLLGSATDRRYSEASTEVTLAGSPSTSWVRPSGVFPDDPGGSVAMETMGPSSARDVAQKPLCGDGAIDDLCACLITQNDRITNGSVTLAHELGHVIGLHHRGNGAGGVDGGSRDKVNHMAGPRNTQGHPFIENCMTYGSDDVAQDFDMIQIMHVRNHKLLQGAPALPPPPPPPPPPEKKAIPDSYLPTDADRRLMQAYLVHKETGLDNGPYDLGPYGPDSDGVDGIIGPITKQGVKDFQRDHGGLVIDGIYGPKTRGAFDEEINGTA